jgi:hypothetical protein
MPPEGDGIGLGRTAPQIAAQAQNEPISDTFSDGRAPLAVRSAGIAGAEAWLRRHVDSAPPMAADDLEAVGRNHGLTVRPRRAVNARAA